MKKVQNLIAIIKLHISLDASVHALLLLKCILAQALRAIHLDEMKEYFTCQYFSVQSAFRQRENPKSSNDAKLCPEVLEITEHSSVH